MPEAPSQGQANTEVPLCVGLDGTLVKSDTVHDSLLILLRTYPPQILASLGKVITGKAKFKDLAGEPVAPDVAHLPYNKELLRYIHVESSRGRKIYLITGADEELAKRVIQHLGTFSGVLASDDITDPFSYIGNAARDMPLLAGAREPMVANPSARLRAKLRARGLQPVRVFDDRVSPVKSLVKATRVHQWAKNILLFLPMVLAHKLNPSSILQTILAFFCFSFTASATYIINDLLDIEADRHHRKKRYRPFAAGELSAIAGAEICFALLAIAFAGAFLLPRAFIEWLTFYLFATLSYSFFLKRIPLLDVLVLSGLYTLRLLAGGSATGTPISQWLAGFSVFLFFSLALVKRFAELENLRISGSQPKNGRGYLMTDIDQLRSFGTASAYTAVMIFALYISGQNVAALYHRPARLWLAVPLLLLWCSRIWLLASRGKLNEDPVVFAFTDRSSLSIGLLIAIVVLTAL